MKRTPVICLVLGLALLLGQAALAEAARDTLNLYEDLFLTQVIYEDESGQALTAPDTELHFFGKAGEMYQNGAYLWGSEALPETFVPSRSEGRVMHVMTLKNPAGERYVPLFTSLDALYYFLGEGIRVGVISYEDAASMVRDPIVDVVDGEQVIVPCDGIVVAPGILNQIIPASEISIE